MRPGRTLFFAYGLFMHTGRMEAVAPAQRRVGRAVLAEWRIGVTRHGLATVAPAPPHRVEGLLWEIDPGAQAALDRFEGVAHGLYRKHRLPVAQPAGAMEALVYVATDPPAPHRRARRGYAEDLAHAAEAAGLSDTYINGLRATLSGRAPPTDTDRGGSF